MISTKTAQTMSEIGIDPNLMLEDMLNKLEDLGYDCIAIRRSSKGYRCTLIYHSNLIGRTFFSKSRKEALTLAMLWSLRDTEEV